MAAEPEKPNPREHWQGIYVEKSAPTVSWYQATPRISLDLIDRTGIGPGGALVDVGGGASTLVDHLLAGGFTRLSVLDIAPAGLNQARARLGADADKVRWLTEDVTQWRPGASFDLWHDRAVFHFLTGARATARAIVRRSRTPCGLAAGRSWRPSHWTAQ